jgi:hypothetical protein
LYFPIRPEPLRMSPGLYRLGTDFGNGEADQRFFPRDETTAHYLAEKARVLAAFPERNQSSVQDDADLRALEAAHDWFRRALAQEGETAAAAAPLEGLGAELVEDFVILRRDPAGDRVCHVHVCFPSGWRPEQLLGQSFAQIHAPIPAIDGVLQKSRSLVDAMVERGPYVRFVWTITADDELDHHPTQGKRAPWSSGTERGFLRVERQTTVPLPAASASVFLIRTYLYGFDDLAGPARATLAQALALMPAEISRYKRLEAALPRALELLR